jgi:hypothetical protein
MSTDMSAKRKCLKCERNFKSSGPHNRVCIPCKSEECYRGDTRLRARVAVNPKTGKTALTIVSGR